jgi:hypothetical protein
MGEIIGQRKVSCLRALHVIRKRGRRSYLLGQHTSLTLHSSGGCGSVHGGAGGRVFVRRYRTCSFLISSGCPNVLFDSKLNIIIIIKLICANIKLKPRWHVHCILICDDGHASCMHPHQDQESKTCTLRINPHTISNARRN